MAVKNVEITTAHNIRIDYELASFSDRLIAFIIDIAIIAGWLILMLIFSAEANPDSRLVFIQIGFTPVFFLYHLVCESLFGGQSVGKKAMGIKVVKMNGHNPALGDCFLRWVLRMIDIFGTIGALASILISSTDHGQRLGDMAANTVVIKLNPPNRYTIADILTIQTQTNYTPIYRQVIQFTDEDMLLIKNSIERIKLYPNENNRKLINELSLTVKDKLKIQEEIKDQVKFLRAVLQDYIVLTR